MEVYNKEIEYNKKLSESIIMTTQYTDKDSEFVCKISLHIMYKTLQDY